MPAYSRGALSNSPRLLVSGSDDASDMHHGPSPFGGVKSSDYAVNSAASIQLPIWGLW
jgi:hypothetical protein